MYIIERYDICTGRWNYMNCAATYSEACEIRDELSRRYRGEFRVSRREGE